MLTRRTRVIAASPRPANQGRSSRVKLHCTELHANRVDGDRTLRSGATPRVARIRADSFCQDQSTKIRARWPARLAFSLGPRYQIPWHREHDHRARRESLTAFGKGGYDDFQDQVPAFDSHPLDLWR